MRAAMAAWITAYLQRVPPPLSPSGLQGAIVHADWWTLGERLDLDEDEIDTFLERLRWRADPLEFGYDGARPVQIHVWTDPDRIRVQLDELEHGQDPPLPPSVRERLRSTRAVVALDLGVSQLESMLSVVAFEIAYHLAETCEGVIQGPDERWYDHTAPDCEPITR